MSVAFGKRRGWIEGLPGLDWACVVLTAFVVADVHFVLASIAREATRHVIFMVGLGSDWGRIGLDWVLFSLAIHEKMLKLRLRVIRTQHATSFPPAVCILCSPNGVRPLAGLHHPNGVPNCFC